MFEDGDDDRVSPWCEPLGADTGVGQGRVDVPEVGSEVTIWPVYDPQIGQGDPDVIYYLSGNHGEGDVPDEYEGPETRVYATRDYVVVVDERLLAERGGAPTLSVRHRTSGDGYQHDAETLSAQASATARITVSSGARIDVTAPAIFLNGRFVLPGGPIR